MKVLAGEKLYWIIFAAPALLILSVFFILPVFGGFIYSFTDWNGIDKHITFIGIKNYIELFTNDEQFYAGFIHTIIFAVSITIFQNIIGLLLALVMDKNFKGRNFFRMIFYMPAVLSSLVVGYAWAFMYNPTIGPINALLKLMRLDFLVNDWLGNPNLALLSIASVVIWQFIGYSMVIFLAGLQGIPVDLYEAGGIDGVTRWQKFRYITFPLIAPALTINILLTMINTLKAFDHVFVMTKGGPGYASEVISTLLYREAFTNNRMGYGSAISVVLFIIITLLSFIMLKYLRGREVVA